MDSRTPTAFPEDSLAGSIALFARVLKDNGFLVSTPTVMDALAGVSLLGIANREDFKAVLKATFMTRAEESAIFDRLFQEFWIDRPAEIERSEISDYRKFPAMSKFDEGLPDAGDFIFEPGVSESQEEAAWSSGSYVIYSPAEILRQKDFREIPEGYDYWMSKLLREITAPLLRRVSRRKRPLFSGHSLDFRRILRQNVKYGGQIYELPRLKPRPRIKKLVFLCDVSGSMSAYQNFMLRFIKELQRLPTIVETFVFSTDLHRITHVLSKLPFDKAMDEIGHTVQDWSGGTRIGHSLQKFRGHWGGSVLGSSTVVLIHSDGWDRGEPELLATEMAKIHRRAYRVMWINPLLGGPAYEPTCRGMRAALPHVDYFLPGHNLLSLERISGTLRGFL